MKFLKAALFGVLVLLAGSANAQTLAHKMSCNELYLYNSSESYELKHLKITRCENNEVICYISDKGDLSCKFK